MAVFNFSDKKQEYILPVSDKKMKLLINTDWDIYGGSSEHRSLSDILKNNKTLVINAFSGILIKL